MINFLNSIELHNKSTYQQQIREKLVMLIEKNTFEDKALPSGRKMAELLKVSRNTIVLVYESLVDEGYLVARKRSGFFVNPELVMVQRFPNSVHSIEQNIARSNHQLDWSKRA